MAGFMSFDKIGSMLARPNEDPNQNDGVPWYMKYGTRALSIFGGGISIVFGLFNCLGLLLGNIDCMLGGIIQVASGFLVLLIEAPCCCLFIDYVQVVSDVVEKRPAWNKAILYMGMPILAVMFCLSLTTIAGSGLIFIAGVLYGMQALGKKAPLEAMKSSAATGGVVQQPFQSQPPATFGASSNYTSFSSSQKSNLIDNAQPPAFTGSPATSVNIY